MKKIMKFFTFLLSVLILVNVNNVLALELESDKIQNSTYIIGTAMFTREGSSSYNGRLSTADIMLAAKTIDSNNIKDMIIYYKNARGVWVNALTNQKVDFPKTIDVQYKNNETFIQLETPTLSNSSGDYGTMLTANLTIGLEGVYAEEGTSSISGYEVYEKNGNEYTLVDSSDDFSEITVTIEPGESKTFVARVYALNSKNEKVYSEYSKELVLTN